MRIFVAAILFGQLLMNCSESKPPLVGLQPYDNFDPKVTDTISLTIERTFNVKTCILKKRTIPKETFINIKSPRYRADQLIKLLKESKPDTIEYIVGLTNNDISFTKKDQFGNIKEPESKYADWGIFGLGYRPGNSSIISSYRLNHHTEAIFIERIKKVSLHELGHNFGLKHCDSELCVMRDAVETIATIDQVYASLCSSCKEKLK
jgi:archaemetzincin